VSPKWPCGLWRRGAIYQYRTRVPADLLTVVGAARINRSLKTASLTVARRLARAAAYEIEQEFEACRTDGEWRGSRSRRAAPSPDQAVMGVRTIQETRSGLTFAQGFESYLTDPTISRTQKSDIVYRSTFATIADRFHEGLQREAIDAERVANVRDLGPVLLELLDGNHASPKGLGLTARMNTSSPVSPVSI
jgi:hypothetical protein